MKDSCEYANTLVKELLKLLLASFVAVLEPDAKFLFAIASPDIQFKKIRIILPISSHEIGEQLRINLIRKLEDSRSKPGLKHVFLP